MYCDDDVYCTTDSFPSLPTDDGVWTGSEQSKITNLNTCTTLVNGVKGMLYARLMTSLAADKLKRCWLGSYEDCKSAARIIIDNKWSLIGFLGPAWVRYYVPMLIQQGIPVYRLPYELASSHDRTSALWHRGSGTWCYGGNGNPNAQRL